MSRPCSCGPFVPDCGKYDTFGDRTIAAANMGRWGRLSSGEGYWTTVFDDPTQVSGVGDGFGYFRPGEAGRLMVRSLPAIGPWQTDTGFTLRHEFMAADTTLDPVRLLIDVEATGGELDWGIEIADATGRGFVYLDSDVDGNSFDKNDWVPDTWYTFELRWRPSANVEIRVWPTASSRPASPDLTCLAGAVPTGALEWQLQATDPSVVGNGPLSDPDAEFRIRNLDFFYVGKPCWGLGCPDVPDDWVETISDPLHGSGGYVDGTAQATIIGADVTLQLATFRTTTGVDSATAQEAVEMDLVTEPVDPNEFTFSAQVDAAVMADVPTSTGAPGNYGVRYDTTFTALSLSFGTDATYSVSFTLRRDWFSVTTGGQWVDTLTAIVGGQYDIGGGTIIEAGTSYAVTGLNVVAGRVAIDRSLSRGTLRFYYPGFGWQEFPISADLSSLTDPKLGSGVFLQRISTHFLGGPDINTALIHQSLVDVVPCIDIPARGAPQKNQEVRREITATGDGVTTVFSTAFPYLTGTLAVGLNGFLADVDTTSPESGVFTFAAPPAVGAIITASYRTA